jgi:hypothetical protein
MRRVVTVRAKCTYRIPCLTAVAMPLLQNQEKKEALAGEHVGNRKR